MARLTEEMVVARTRASDLSSIKKLNCWGSELSDVSLLRRMTNVEVLSLSVNRIEMLSDFQYCKNLQDLYVRKNNIADLNQICYLQNLPRLRNLFLKENPCADTDSYRLTVLRALPQLETLDNVAVHPEEVQDAQRKGRELLHPDAAERDQANSPDVLQWPSGSSSPDTPAQQEERRMESVYYDEYEDDEREARTPATREPSPPARRSSAVPDHRQYDTPEPPPSRKHSAPPHDDFHHHEEQRLIPHHHHHHHQAASEYDERGYTRHYAVQHSSPYEVDEEAPRVERMNRPTLQHTELEQRMANQRVPPIPRRPIIRNSNILSAVLCLIKELDYPSLEVVEVAVRSRIDEIQD